MLHNNHYKISQNHCNHHNYYSWSCGIRVHTWSLQCVICLEQLTKGAVNSNASFPLDCLWNCIGNRYSSKNIGKAFNFKC